MKQAKHARTQTTRSIINFRQAKLIAFFTEFQPVSRRKQTLHALEGDNLRRRRRVDNDGTVTISNLLNANKQISEIIFQSKSYDAHGNPIYLAVILFTERH